MENVIYLGNFVENLTTILLNNYKREVGIYKDYFTDFYKKQPYSCKKKDRLDYSINSNNENCS